DRRQGAPRRPRPCPCLPAGARGVGGARRRPAGRRRGAPRGHRALRGAPGRAEGPRQAGGQGRRGRAGRPAGPHPRARRRGQEGRVRVRPGLRDVRRAARAGRQPRPLRRPRGRRGRLRGAGDARRASRLRGRGLRPARPPRARPAARRHRRRARRQGVRLPLLLPHGPGRGAGARAPQPRHEPRAPQRVHAGDPARPGQAVRHGGHRLPGPGGAGRLPPGGGRPLPRGHRGGPAGGVPLRRGAGRRLAAAAVRRLQPQLPPRGRLLREGHPRHLPGALVRQGRDVRLLRPRERRGRAPAAAGLGEGVHRRPGDPVPGARAGRRRPRPQRRPQVRLLRLAAHPGPLPRDHLDLQLHRVPGPAAECPGALRGRHRAGGDAQRHALRHDPDDHHDPGEPPAGRRLRPAAGGAAPVPRRPRGPGPARM
ncbi:MAG: Seryl-tRNA synthetase, partial [uncultured Friedmanniella sp.]